MPRGAGPRGERVGRRGERRAKGTRASAGRHPAGTRPTPASVYGVLAAVAAGVAWLWPHVADATRLWIWDDYTYHMIYPTLWLRDHAIAAPTPARSFTMQAWYPLSASLVSAWFMLPFPRARGEALAWVSLTAPLYAGIFAAGAAALMRRLGAGAAAWAPAVVLFLTSQRIATMASTFSDADLALATALFAAFVFAVPREARARLGVRADAWYAAALSGIAVGIKVSAAAPALIVLAMSLLRAGAAAPGAPIAGAMRVALAFGVSWTLTGGYWYLRNLIVRRQSRVSRRVPHLAGRRVPRDLARRVRAPVRRRARDLGRRRRLSPLAASLRRDGRGRSRGRRRLGRWRRRFLTRPAEYFTGGALALVAAILVSLPGTPYSAGNAMTFRSGFIHWDSMRYVALVVLLGWVALAWVVDAGGRAARAIGGPLVVSAALIVGWQPRLRTPFSSDSRWSRPSWLVSRGARTAHSLPRVLRAPASGHRLCDGTACALAARRHGSGGPAVARRDGAGRSETPADRRRRRGWSLRDRRRGRLRALAPRGEERGDGAPIHDERFFGGAARALDALPPRTRVAVFGDQSVVPRRGRSTRPRPDPPRSERPVPRSAGRGCDGARRAHGAARDVRRESRRVRRARGGRRLPPASRRDRASGRPRSARSRRRRRAAPAPRRSRDRVGNPRRPSCVPPVSAWRAPRARPSRRAPVRGSDDARGIPTPGSTSRGAAVRCVKSAGLIGYDGPAARLARRCTSARGSGRTSMTRWRSTMTALAIAVLLGSPTAAPAQAPKSGGVLNVDAARRLAAGILDPRDVDDLDDVASHAVLQQPRAVRSAEARPRAWTPIVGELAERWSWQDGYRNLVFFLRKGVKWHDGQPFTSKDVKYTFDMVREAPDAAGEAAPQPAQGLVRQRRGDRGGRPAHRGLPAQAPAAVAAR